MRKNASSTSRTTAKRSRACQMSCRHPKCLLKSSGKEGPVECATEQQQQLSSTRLLRTAIVVYQVDRRRRFGMVMRAVTSCVDTIRATQATDPHICAAPLSTRLDQQTSAPLQRSPWSRSSPSKQPTFTADTRLNPVVAALRVHRVADQASAGAICTLNP
jgi:hypothetical protein